MPVDVIVRSPRSIGNLEELDEVVSRIHAYEKESGTNAGVIHIQRRLFGSLYLIVSEEEAKRWLKTPVKQTTCEWGIKYYSRSFFDELRVRLSSKREPQYS